MLQRLHKVDVKRNVQFNDVLRLQSDITLILSLNFIAIC